MQDSFDARMQGQTPATVKPAKSGKGWMAATIILLIGVIALGVTEFLAYQEIAKKDEELSKKDAEISQLRENNEKDEKDSSIQDLSGRVFIDGSDDADEKDKLPVISDSLDGSVMMTGVGELSITKDGKYIVMQYGTGVVSGPNAGAHNTFTAYRNLKDDQGWEAIVGRQSAPECKGLDTSGEIEFYQSYGDSSKKTCIPEGGDPEHTITYEEYYKRINNK